MRLYEFTTVVESLNGPADWRWENNVGAYNAVASISGQNDLMVTIEDVAPDEWVVSFTRERDDGRHSSLATGQGAEFKVFATVADIVMSWWNEVTYEGQMPESISFTASKQAGDSAGRSKLYARLAKKFAEKIGYFLAVNNNGEKRDEFILNRPDDYVAESRVIFARKKSHGKSTGAQTQMFRCSSGPRAGRRVSHPSQCGAPQDPAKKAAMIKTRARTEIRQARRARKTKKKDPGSKLAHKLNATRH